jgi:hypothetical protein
MVEAEGDGAKGGDLKDNGPTALDKSPCLSFATDLLGSFEAVKKKVW